MKAIVHERFGGAEVLSFKEVDDPVPGEGQIVVRVKAASLNMYDWHMVTGTPYLARLQAGFRKPKRAVPGSDIAGVVELVGEGANEFDVGDEVFGSVGMGSFAELARSSGKNLAFKPDAVPYETAATIPMAGLTALQGLRDHGHLEAGQRVLINGASGGVGTFAVQIAKALGAEVTAVCSTAKVAMVRSIGADKVIDYTSSDFVGTERGYDLLFDNVGNRGWRETRQVLGPNGVNVTITGPKNRWAGPMRNNLFCQIQSIAGSQRFSWFVASEKRADLEFLATLTATGELSPVIEQTYTLADTPEAFRYLGEGHVAGKLVVTP